MEEDNLLTDVKWLMTKESGQLFYYGNNLAWLKGKNKTLDIIRFPEMD